MMPPDGWLTVEQVAERLGCSKQTVYRYARLDGLTVHLRRGYRRGRYIKADELDEWIKAQFESVTGDADD